jgi:hypothetical protein
MTKATTQYIKSKYTCTYINYLSYLATVWGWLLCFVDINKYNKAFKTDCFDIRYTLDICQTIMPYYSTQTQKQYELIIVMKYSALLFGMCRNGKLTFCPL